ncbi:MAG: (deoxy)nucleoside triphosphate pyrophosphohydrolase [Terriglobales bacterium]
MKLVAAALILREDRVLACQRTKYQTMPLKWEFPGGKVEQGEQPTDALRRELEEELGIMARIGDEVARIKHVYKNGNVVELRFFLVREFEGVVENRIFADLQWVERARLPDYDFLEADLELVRQIAAGGVI